MIVAAPVVGQKSTYITVVRYQLEPQHGMLLVATVALLLPGALGLPTQAPFSFDNGAHRSVANARVEAWALNPLGDAAVYRTCVPAHDDL